jgi:ribA/ribD-fused uncharacterized protein
MALDFAKLYPEEKTSETHTHIYFLNGPFSQWYPTNFVMSMKPDGEQYLFNCAEQYMMAGKAILFGDEETFLKIMAVQQTADWHYAPKAQKELGRKVKNFDPKVWDDAARRIVFQGNWAKFTQNAVIKKRLLETSPYTLVEGAHYDKVWGVGLAWNDPKIIDHNNWLGLNWLGYTLEAVRLAIQEHDGESTFDPFAFEDFRLTRDYSGYRTAMGTGKVDFAG